MYLDRMVILHQAHLASTRQWQGDRGWSLTGSTEIGAFDAALEPASGDHVVSPRVVHQAWLFKQQPDGEGAYECYTRRDTKVETSLRTIVQIQVRQIGYLVIGLLATQLYIVLSFRST